MKPETGFFAARLSIMDGNFEWPLMAYIGLVFYERRKNVDLIVSNSDIAIRWRMLFYPDRIL